MEVYTEQKLEKFGLNAVQVPRNFLYNETFEQYGRPTQVDVTIDDKNDNEVAIIECKAYTTKWNDVDQAQRLVHVANERGIPLIFSTSDGTTDCFSSRVKEVLNETQYFVISPDNIFFADPSDVKENGVTLGLPPEIKSHWNSNSSDSGGASLSSDGGGEALLGGLISSFVGFFGSSPNPESSDTSDSKSSDPGDSGGSWDLFGNWFGDSSDLDPIMEMGIMEMGIMEMVAALRTCSRVALTPNQVIFPIQEVVIREAADLIAALAVVIVGGKPCFL
ncbi:MAG: hypothetical protein EAZ96_07675 [Oscillatoriales cyanobacterium]|nr:MAG: hypothetical protein EAZ96_07675 [Oscillatoriales cyanobacterium]